MNDSDPASQNLYPTDEMGNGAVVAGDNLSPFRTLASGEAALHGLRSGTANDLTTSELVLGSFDLPTYPVRSPQRDEASYRRVLAGPWQVKNLPTASNLAERIVETFDEALVLLDADLRVHHANPAFYDTFQVGPEETEHHDFFELGSGHWNLPWLRASLVRILGLDSRLDDAEVEQVFPTIGPKTMLVNAQRLVGPGADALILLTIEDITELKAMEKQRRDAILLLGHELRNPLAVIRAYAQLMQRRRGTGQKDEMSLGVILDQTRQLSRLIDDLLASPDLGAEQLRLDPGQMDLAALAHAAAQQAQLLAPLHAVRLELPQGPLEGHWDRGRLAQVFANLLGNASKYSPAGGEIVVRIEDLGQTVQISIKDQGPGIAADALPRIFDRFYRVAATAQQVQGRGLGLHISRTIVEAHGGSISVESALGLGTSFRVTLPLDRAR